MENYHYQPPISSPNSPWMNVTGDQNSSSSSLHYQPKERRGPGSGKRSGGSSIKLSTDPQSVAARQRRHRISDRFRVLKSLVPGGSKMDTVSMLEEAINYVKFLKTQIWLHQAAMMIPHDHDLVPLDAAGDALQVTTTGTANVAASYMIPPNEEMLSYNYATTAVAPTSTNLPPLPYCSFYGEEDQMLLPPVNFNY